MLERYLNSNFERYILADINPDLINLFNIVKENVEGYIEDCKSIFFAMMPIHSIITMLNVANSMHQQILFERSIIFYV